MEQERLADISDDDLLIEVGLRLLKARRRRKLKLQDVSDATGIGISTISRYETGRVQPGLANVVRLAELYDVSIQEVLGDLWDTRVLSNGELTALDGGGTTSPPRMWQAALDLQ
jgi:transcriptional regulator with XRE-family HTH domain